LYYIDYKVPRLLMVLMGNFKENKDMRTDRVDHALFLLPV
jgi:hypothetical protein